MSVLAYPPTNDEEIFKRCTKDCGVVTATEDFQYFTLSCKFCAEKFLYFDAFIGHMQTVHLECNDDEDDGGGGIAAQCDELTGYGGIGTTLIPPTGTNMRHGVCNNDPNGVGSYHLGYGNEHADLTDADPSLLEPQMVIKQELQDDCVDNENLMIDASDIRMDDQQSSDQAHDSAMDIPLEMDFLDDPAHYDYNYGNNRQDNDDDNGSPQADDHGSPQADDNDSSFPNYDEMVEEALLGQDSELTMHIKDRKMIQFLIDSYHRNPFLWDHRHPQFRDRVKRQRFLEWIVAEFKRRFNISLAKDAITRKWDNLRTVYKRECNRMALERTNISTLWYFRELHFLNSLYSYNCEMSDVAVIQETSYRRRFSAIWNDVSTAKLLSMVKRFKCFYIRSDPDYRSKEKRGEALQVMANELQQTIEVSTIQISKRISQLRFDYSKQKSERLNCERQMKKFLPSYTYYEQMRFMDDDVPPFKCQQCPEILQSHREMDLHIMSHQTNGDGFNQCTQCNIFFQNAEECALHKQMHATGGVAGGVIKESKYHCDLCTASFREKGNYDEHMRRHNDELLLPSLSINATTPKMEAGMMTAGADGVAGIAATSGLPLMAGLEPPKPYACDVCHRTFASQGHLNAHRVVHTDSRERRYKCDYPHCGSSFLARQSLHEHVKMHYSDDEYKCDICGKGFKSSKNLQNHKQIHDTVKRYVCQICGSAFAQAAGLYLHKRRHNRPNPTGRNSL